MRRQCHTAGLQTGRRTRGCCPAMAWVPLGGCHPRGAPPQVSFTQGQGVLQGTSAGELVQLCGCPLSSPTVPVGAWLCLCVSWLSLPQCLWMSLCGPCPCPGMGVWAVPVRVSLGYPCVVPVCASPTRAGGLGGVPARVSLCACASPAAPGLCDSGGVWGGWGSRSCPPGCPLADRQTGRGRAPSPPRGGLQGAQPGSA